MIEWWEQSEEKERELQEKLKAIGSDRKDNRRDHKKRLKSHEQVKQEIADRMTAFFAPTETVRIENLSHGFRPDWDAAFHGIGVLPVKVTTTKQPQRNTKYSPLPFRASNINREVATNYRLFDGEPLINGKFEVIEVTPPKQPKGYYYLLPDIKGMALQARFLNPEIAYEVLDDYMGHLMTAFSSFLPVTWRKHKAHLLTEVMAVPYDQIEPKFSTVKTLWNPDYDFTPEERRSILQEYRQRAKGNKTLQTLIQLYREMDNPTQKQLAEESGKSLRQIKRYWPQITDNEFLKAA